MMSEYRPHGPYDSPPRPDRCKASVPFGGRRVDFHQCLRKPVKDGWCKQHHPDSVAKRRAQGEIRRKQIWARGPWARLHKAQEENTRLKARITELHNLCQQIVIQRDEAQGKLAEAEIGLMEYEKQIAELEAEGKA